MLLSTVESNQQIAGLIKSIRVSIIIEGNGTHSRYVEKLFSSLLFLEAISLQSPSYCQILLDALLDSKLPQLKYISTKKLGTNLNDFITCALLLRKQLETVQTWPTFRPRNSEPEIFKLIRCIYSRLDQFERLSELYICKLTKNDIGSMENVLEDCPLIKRSAFHSHTTRILLKAKKNIVIAECTPKNDIKLLGCTGKIIDISRYLTYVMHKFPQLNSLFLELDTDFPQEVDAVLLNQLMIYLSRIRGITVNGLIAKRPRIFGNLLRISILRTQEERYH